MMDLRWDGQDLIWSRHMKSGLANEVSWGVHVGLVLARGEDTAASTVLLFLICDWNPRLKLKLIAKIIINK